MFPCSQRARGARAPLISAAADLMFLLFPRSPGRARGVIAWTGPLMAVVRAGRGKTVMNAGWRHAGLRCSGRYWLGGRHLEFYSRRSSR